MGEKEKIVEAFLFANPKPILLKELGEKLEMKDTLELERTIINLAKKYSEIDSAIEIKLQDNHAIMSIKSPYDKAQKEFISGKKMKKSLLKTLSLIALKQPISQSQLAKLRTNNAYNEIKELEKQGIISKTRVGRSSIIRTTKKFSEIFSIEKQEQKN